MAMRIFRHWIPKRFLSLLTGVVFLNLSLVLLEIQAVGIQQQDPVAVKSLISLLCDSGLEEEGDGSSEGSPQYEDDVKLFHRHQCPVNPYYQFIISDLNESILSLRVLDKYFAILVPPPEIN